MASGGGLSRSSSLGSSEMDVEPNCEQPTWPERGSLAKILEGIKSVRERLRDAGHMTRWPDIQCTGVPSVRSMGLNARILEETATWWCPHSNGPVYIPINLCRQEAFWHAFRLLMHDSGLQKYV